MYFDNPPGGEHPPVRTEAHIHALYRKLFSFVRVINRPNQITREVIITLQGLFGADGAVQCHIFEDGARFIAAIGTLSHMEKASFDVNSPKVIHFLNGGKAKVFSREELKDYIAVAMNARFESAVITPVAIDGHPYGLVALISNRANYFQENDAETLYNASLFLSMLFKNRERELSSQMHLYIERLSNACRKVAPDLYQNMAELTESYDQIHDLYMRQYYGGIAELLAKSRAELAELDQHLKVLNILAEMAMPEHEDFGSLNLGPIIKSVAETNRAAIEPYAQLKIMVSDNLPSVRGDERIVVQIVNELMTNALRAIQHGHGLQNEIIVHAYALPAFAVIDISDTGCGMTPSDEHHLFEVFFSNWPPNKGLGLSRAIINAYRLRGNIYYRPREKGGASFRLTIPDENHFPQDEVF